MCSIRYTRAPFDSQCCHTAESRRARGGKTKPSRDGLLKTRPFLPSGHAGVLMRPNVEPQEHTPPRSTSHARRHMPQARTSAHTASPEVSNEEKGSNRFLLTLPRRAPCSGPHPFALPADEVQHRTTRPRARRARVRPHRRPRRATAGGRSPTSTSWHTLQGFGRGTMTAPIGLNIQFV